MKKIQIVADHKIPFLRGVLEPFAEIKYLPGREITAQEVKKADALIIRTRTKCDQDLLHGSSVKLITTATIGFDHIDCDYCQKEHIFWYNSIGCNASSVCQYIASVLVQWAKSMGENLSEKTIGIIGVGNVGSRVSSFCHSLNMKVLQNDPLREEREGNENFVSLNQLLEECDIITLHTPLEKEGKYPTFHLADESFFKRVKKGLFFINSSRGEVVKTGALIEAFQQGSVSNFALDVYEEEPQVQDFLLKNSFVSTPHIAGYSLDGKANGTADCIHHIADFFDIAPLRNWHPQSIPTPSQSQDITIDVLGKSLEEVYSMAIIHSYDVLQDSKKLKENPERFESLREDYPVRREFPYFRVHLKNSSPQTSNVLRKIGFNVVEE